MDALYAERDLCGAIVALGKDYLVRIKGNRPVVQQRRGQHSPDDYGGERVVP